MLNQVQLQLNSVIAVSGGVDSMVLLDIATKSLPKDSFVVAHFNHKVRSDEEHLLDKELVADYCLKNVIRLEIGERSLSGNYSEDVLRRERYIFLTGIKDKYSYNTIITGHHSDDLVETIAINLARGTGWRGLASIENSSDLQRPLLNVKKDDILQYAKKYDIQWNEDVTNQDMLFLRNKLRKMIEKKRDEVLVDEVLMIADKQSHIAGEIEEILDALTVWLKDKNSYSATLLKTLPYRIRSEVMYYILKKYNLRTTINATLIFNALHFVHTAKAGSSWDVSSEVKLVMARNSHFKIEI